MDGSTANQRPAAASLARTPREGAKALVTGDERVLLVEERHADGAPFWTLPGGGVEGHECPREGLDRELLEELGCRGHVGAAVDSFWYAHRSLGARVSRYTVYDCALRAAPTPNPAEGVYAARWVDPADPPARTLPQVRQVCGAVADD